MIFDQVSVRKSLGDTKRALPPVKDAAQEPRRKHINQLMRTEIGTKRMENGNEYELSLNRPRF